jgi:proline iminopeptidase
MRLAINDTEIFFDVDGPELEVTEHGLQQRATVVALHGGPGLDHGYLRPGLGWLSRRVQLVYVDLRGQGRSGRVPVASCTLEQMADDVAALCAAIGIERPVVLGHSAGGFVALHIAIRYPNLAAGLILCCTSPTLAPIPDSSPPPGLADRAGVEAEAVMHRLFSGDASPATLQAFGEHVAPFYAGPDHVEVPAELLRLSAMNPDLIQHFFANLAPHYDLRPRLRDIAVPTLVLAGEYDWVCPPAASRCIANSIPGAALVEIARAGHFPFSEEPDRFRHAVSDFLDRGLTEGTSEAMEPTDRAEVGAPALGGGGDRAASL